MCKGFKDLLMRGNMVDLAVTVVVGVAFAKVVSGLLHSVINPLLRWPAGSFVANSIASMLPEPV
jgi:large conductance mechanosensitive channel protein